MYQPNTKVDRGEKEKKKKKKREKHKRPEGKQ